MSPSTPSMSNRWDGCRRCWANTSTRAGWGCSPPTRRWRAPPDAHALCTSARERREHVVGPDVCGDARLDAGDAASRRRAHHLVFFRDRGEPVSPRGWAGDEYPAPHGAGGGVGGGAACVDVVAGQVVFRGLRGRQFGAISARAATTDKTGFG